MTAKVVPFRQFPKRTKTPNSKEALIDSYFEGMLAGLEEGRRQVNSLYILVTQCTGMLDSNGTKRAIHEILENISAAIVYASKSKAKK